MASDYINEGIENLRRRGSRIVAEGVRMLPAASLLKAAGVIGSMADRAKPFVTVVNSYTTHIPGHGGLPCVSGCQESNRQRAKDPSQLVHRRAMLS